MRSWPENPAVFGCKRKNNIRENIILPDVRELVVGQSRVVHSTLQSNLAFLFLDCAAYIHNASLEVGRIQTDGLKLHCLDVCWHFWNREPGVHGCTRHFYASMSKLE